MQQNNHQTSTSAHCDWGDASPTGRDSCCARVSPSHPVSGAIVLYYNTYTLDYTNQMLRSTAAHATSCVVSFQVWVVPQSCGVRTAPICMRAASFPSVFRKWLFRMRLNIYCCSTLYPSDREYKPSLVSDVSIKIVIYYRREWYSLPYVAPKQEKMDCPACVCSAIAISNLERFIFE